MAVFRGIAMLLLSFSSPIHWKTAQAISQAPAGDVARTAAKRPATTVGEPGTTAATASGWC